MRRDPFDDPHFIEITGVILWYNDFKGYGYISPDDPTLESVLIHQECLRKSGFNTAFPGARLVVVAMKKPGGLCAFRVKSMDHSNANLPSPPKPYQFEHVVPVSGFVLALNKWFNRVRGFGYLTRGGGTRDIYLHISTLKRFGFEEIRPGQLVQVRYGFYKGGLIAVVVKAGAGNKTFDGLFE